MERNRVYHFVVQIDNKEDYSFSLKGTQTFHSTLTNLTKLHQKYLIFHYNGQLIKPGDTPMSIKASYSPLGAILNDTNNTITGQFIDQGYKVLKLMKRGIDGIIVKVDVSTTLKELREVIDEYGLVRIEKLNYEGGNSYYDENFTVLEINVDNDSVFIFHDDSVQILSGDEFIKAENDAKRAFLKRKAREYELTMINYENRWKSMTKKSKVQSLSPPKTPTITSTTKSKSSPSTACSSRASRSAKTLVKEVQTVQPMPHSNSEYKCNHTLPSGKPCLKTFTRPYDLTRHEKHTHLNPNKLFCVLCQKKDHYKEFGRLDSLRRHYRAKHLVRNEDLRELIEISRGI